MIVKEDFLNKLRRYFSLNLYEVKTWAALLSRGIATAGELSDIANVPRSRSYDVLESLEKKGFCITKLGKPIKYIAVPPSEVLERVKKNLKTHAEQQITKLEELKGTDLVDELNSLHNQGIDLVEPTDLSGSLKGRHNLYNHIELTLRGAEKSVTLVTTTRGLMRKVEGLKPVFEKLKERGVDIKIAAPLNSSCADVVKDMEGLAEVRHADNITARFCIVDGKELIFMVLDDKDVHPTYDVGIWVNTPFFANAIDNIFSVAWSKMKPSKDVLKH